MIDNNLLVADIREYSWKLYELFDRYLEGTLVFPDSDLKLSTKRNNISKILKAVNIGIPFPDIMFIELQSGKLLVIESIGRLKSIIEYMKGDYEVALERLSLKNEENGLYTFDELPAVMKRSIKTMNIFSHVIKYDTPAFLQLFIIDYTENLSLAHIEAVRHMIYEGRGIEIIQAAIREHGNRRYSANREYEFITFLTYIVNYMMFRSIENNIEQFQMQERMFDWIIKHESFVYDMYVLYSELDSYFQSDSLTSTIIRNFTIQGLGNRFSNTNIMISHLLGVSIAACGRMDSYDTIIKYCLKIISKINIRDVNYDRVFYEMLRDSDLSYGSLERIITYISRG